MLSGSTVAGTKMGDKKAETSFQYAVSLNKKLKTKQKTTTKKKKNMMNKNNYNYNNSSTQYSFRNKIIQLILVYIEFIWY